MSVIAGLMARLAPHHEHWPCSKCATPPTLACEVLLLKPGVGVLAGARVGLCELPLDWIQSDERGGLGGTCILRGCVPKKLMHYAGSFTEDLEDASSFGWGHLPGVSVHVPGPSAGVIFSHPGGPLSSTALQAQLQCPPLSWYCCQHWSQLQSPPNQHRLMLLLSVCDYV